MVGLPLYGINLPKHFIACYKSSENDVEFYLNPFSKGAVFNREDIIDFLKQLKVEPKESFFQPCSNVDMIERCLVNLDYSYQKLGYENKLKEIRKLMRVLNLNNADQT
jgi:regulator of sirC expression with transglutaminase-like and TPR domain